MKDYWAKSGDIAAAIPVRRVRYEYTERVDALALTWEDMRSIVYLFCDMLEANGAGVEADEAFFTELLEKFQNGE